MFFQSYEMQGQLNGDMAPRSCQVAGKKVEMAGSGKMVGGEQMG